MIQMIRMFFSELQTDRGGNLHQQLLRYRKRKTKDLQTLVRTGVETQIQSKSKIEKKNSIAT